MHLNIEANTKRQVFQSIAQQYDVFIMSGSCLDWARLSVHRLQCTNAGWDTPLDDPTISKWKKIVKQATWIEINRSVGNRTDEFRLVTFVDASMSINAAVLYLKSLRTNEARFLLGKNRIVNEKLKFKKILSL